MLTPKEIQYYIDLLTDLNDGKKFSYDELVKELLVNFGIRITKNELMKLDEPTAIDLAVDSKILYRIIN